jgi:uncharacterized protein RhaS with RHS repeats
MLYDANGNPSSDSGQALTNIINGVTTNKLVWSARNQLTNMLVAVTTNFLTGFGITIKKSDSSMAMRG